VFNVTCDPIKLHGSLQIDIIDQDWNQENWDKEWPIGGPTQLPSLAQVPAPAGLS
jgi:hypothetical protein